MPYVVCVRCNLRTYSAALWSATDVCPSCGTELPRGRATIVSISTHPRFSVGRRGAPAQPPDRAPEARHE
jgi:hypothetical protein